MKLFVECNVISALLLNFRITFIEFLSTLKIRQNNMNKMKEEGNGEITDKIIGLFLYFR